MFNIGESDEPPLRLDEAPIGLFHVQSQNLRFVRSGALASGAWRGGCVGLAILVGVRCVARILYQRFNIQIWSDIVVLVTTIHQREKKRVYKNKYYG